MHCAVSAMGRAGRMSRRDVVELAVVAAAEALVCDLAVVDFAFAPSRKLSLGVLSLDLFLSAFPVLFVLPLLASASRVLSRRDRRAGGHAVLLRRLYAGGRFRDRVPIGSEGLLVGERSRRVGRSGGVAGVEDLGLRGG